MKQPPRGLAAHFVNVDLDIYSTRDLQPIVRRFGGKVDVLYVGLDRGKYCAHIEIAQNTKTADSTIRAFCGLIESLPKSERTLWNNAAVRSFSIGIRAGTHQNPCDFTIRPKTVKAVSDLGAQIVLTIYAPEQLSKQQR
jgi:hypothetical protein